MKRIATTLLALSLVLCLLSGSFAVLAERYVWEEGKVPTGWTHITLESEVAATNTMAPVNPNASQESKNLYAYLCTLTDSPYIMTGQFDITGDNHVQDTLKKEYGLQPALYSSRYTVDVSAPVFASNTSPVVTNSSMAFTNVDDANARFKKFYDAGNVLLVHSDSAPRTLCADVVVKKGKYKDAGDAIIELDKTNPDRDPQAYGLWMLYQEHLIDALKKLEASGVKAYMWRPWIEFNYNNFNGISDNGKAAFVRVFQQTVQMLIDAGLTGFLVDYSPGNGYGNDNTVTRDPGNEYVDVYSVTLYSENLGRVSGDTYVNYNWYVKTGKPIGIAEYGCRTGSSANSVKVARGSWFDLLQDTVSYWPNVCWVNCWGDEAYSLMDLNGDRNGNDDGMLFMDCPYTLELSEITDYRQGVIPAPGVVQLFTGETEYVGLEMKDYTAADLSKMGLDLKKVCGLRPNSGFAVVFYANADCTGEYWGYAAENNCILPDVAKNFKSCSVRLLDNVLLNKEQVFASVRDGISYNVNDGRTSAWNVDLLNDENEADPGTAWVYVDLESPYTVCQYTLKNAGYRGEAAPYNTVDFKIQYSNDGEVWKTIHTVTGNTLSQVNHNVKPVTAQYFRLLITKPNSSTVDSEKGEFCVVDWEMYGLDAGNALIPEEPSYPEGTGLFKVDGEWLYIEDGEWMSDYCGFVKHTASNTWFYVTDGKIDWNLEGAFKHPSGIWFIVKGGQIDWSYNGFYKANGVWFYFTNGQIVWETTGLFKHPSGQWFYVKNAQIDWGYTGFGKHLASNTWFYCENGTIAWSKSGAFKHPSGIWFMVNGGQIDWKYNGFYKVSGIWFYFENGQINWNLTGLYKLPSANAWFYVRNAQIDWNYNGKAVKNGVTFNVRNGQVIF